jgi:hypothetical protein
VPSPVIGSLVIVVDLSRAGPKNQIAPLVQRTNGVVVPPAGSALGPGSHIATGGSHCPLDALSGINRTTHE